MPDRPAAPNTEPARAREAYEILLLAMDDIAKGRWNTASASLDLPGNLSAIQYAQAALRAALAAREETT